MEKRNGGFSTFGNGKVQHQDNCRAMGGPSIRISLFRRIPRLRQSPLSLACTLCVKYRANTYYPSPIPLGR